MGDLMETAGIEPARVSRREYRAETYDLQEV